MKDTVIAKTTENKNKIDISVKLYMRKKIIKRGVLVDYVLCFMFICMCLYVCFYK